MIARVTNIFARSVGIPGGMLPPGHTTFCEMSEDEYLALKQCDFLEVSDSFMPPSGGGTVQGKGNGSGDKGCLLKNDEVGSPLKRKRALRLDEAESGNPGESGPDGSGKILEDVYREP